MLLEKGTITREKTYEVK